MSSRRRDERLLMCVGFAGGGALWTYAIDRVGHALLGSEPNPATIIWSLHAGFFWRQWISLFIGGFVAIIVWLVSERSYDACERWLPSWLYAGVALLALQALFVP